MKNLSLCLVAVLSVLFTLACEHCDDSATVNNPNARFVATYRLAFINTPLPIDSNGDGNPSANLLEENHCYSGSFVTLNSDRTYRLRHNSPILNIGEINCASQTTVGNWIANGNTIALSTVEQTRNFTFDEKTESLVHIADMEYQHVNADGEMVALNGEVECVFER